MQPLVIECANYARSISFDTEVLIGYNRILCTIKIMNLLLSARIFRQIDKIAESIRHCMHTYIHTYIHFNIIIKTLEC